MSREFPEPDWKVFRRLRELALNRFCERVLIKLAQISAEKGKSAHERYLIVYRSIHDQDQSLGDAFDNPRRSTAFLQLLRIHSMGLITEDEFAQFSAETQARVTQFID